MVTLFHRSYELNLYFQKIINKLQCMKHQILFLFIIIPGFIFSQTAEFKKPNYKKIEKEISKKESIFFYNSLFKRYQNGDTTLNIQEKRHLYYGGIFQDTYSPYGSSDYIDSIKIILKNNILTDTDYQNIIRFSDLIFIENPFDLEALNYALFACDKSGQKDLLNKKYAQMNVIFDAVLSSGDGLEKESAFYVIYISHEYAVLNILGFEFGSQQRLIEHYDFLKVNKNKYNIEGFYFDVSPSLNHLNEIYK
ncbi:MAG: hypothetical protein DRI94_09895 [Bacteroidetes bacterium]|nr:MAG: hypothetical protein DRI94_09895 [Bacteroidota bacterium]